MKNNEKDTPGIDNSQIEIPPYRTEAEILKDIEELCTSKGYIHCLAFLCWRENFIKFDPKKLETKDLNYMKSPERLIRKEISMLCGFMAKKPIDSNHPTTATIEEYIGQTEKLCSELHDCMNYQILSSFNTCIAEGTSPLSLGSSLKEPIFYAGENAFLFQYRDFAEKRYELDSGWLKENKGYLPTDLKKVISAIEKVQLRKILEIRKKTDRNNIEGLTLLPAFTHTKDEIAKEYGCSEKMVGAIMSSFSLKSLPCNENFTGIGSYSEIESYPFIPLDENNYVLLQTYVLAESSYDTPAYWMGQDKSYMETAKKNRGFFTESFSAESLRKVLGKDHVFENVYVMKGKNRVGEIDVFAIYADRAIILQAKSKKLTEAARQGADEALRRDFKKAIQEAYDQGLKCAESLDEAEYYLADEKGVRLSIRRNFSEIFIFCVISEYYPALAHQSGQFLSQKEHLVIRPAYVMDVFFLDVLCELLDTPLHFFNFLHQRAKYASRVKSDNELSVLSYHLTQNLWFKDDLDFIAIGEDFSVDVDSAMLTRREGLPGKRTPEGILTKHRGTFFGSIIDQLSRFEADDILELGYFLLELSEDAGNDISKACRYIINKAQKDRKIHDFAMLFGHTGLTFHTNYFDPETAKNRLHAHCLMKKYQQKSERWFGISIYPNASGKIKIALGLNSKWQESEVMENVMKDYPNKSGAKTISEAITAENIKEDV